MLLGLVRSDMFVEKCTKSMSIEEFDEWSYEMCVSDSICKERFYVKSTMRDYDNYVYMFHIFLQEVGDDAYMREYVHCHDSTRKLWLHMMRRARFCTENEDFVSGTGCVCKQGKVCHELDAQNYSIDIRTMSGVIFAAFLFMLILIYNLLTKTADIRDQWILVSKKLSDLQKTYNNREISNYPNVVNNNLKQRTNNKDTWTLYQI